MRAEASATPTGVKCFSIEQLNGFGNVLNVANKIIEEAKERRTWPDKRISASLLYALQDALKQCGNMSKLAESLETWECNCGHVNGPNLAECSACSRSPGCVV